MIENKTVNCYVSLKVELDKKVVFRKIKDALSK